jgi:hypothetical protein
MVRFMLMVVLLTLNRTKICRAGGWKNSSMPARYTQQASHALGGMAELFERKQ